MSQHLYHLLAKSFALWALVVIFVPGHSLNIIMFNENTCHNGSYKMCQNVFVYGTLKRDEPNHYWLTNPEHGYGKFLGEGRTVTKYPLIIATKYNIPFLLFKPGVGHNVKGEIYEVDELMLSKLDVLEEHPNYYERELDKIEILKKDDSQPETMTCWVYFLKKFKQDLLSRPHMENYASLGDHGMPYMERSKQDPKYDSRLDLY